MTHGVVMWADNVEFEMGVYRESDGNPVNWLGTKIPIPMWLYHEMMWARIFEEIQQNAIDQYLETSL